MVYEGRLSCLCLRVPDLVFCFPICFLTYHRTIQCIRGFFVVTTSTSNKFNILRFINTTMDTRTTTDVSSFHWREIEHYRQKVRSLEGYINVLTPTSQQYQTFTLTVMIISNRYWWVFTSPSYVPNEMLTSARVSWLKNESCLYNHGSFSKF